MDKKEMQKLLKQANETREKIKNAIKEILAELNEPVEWEWEDYAPSYASGQFGDDLNDSFITKIWLDNDTIMVNLYAYYLGEEKENIDLADECCVDWEDILDNLLTCLDE